MLYVLLIIIVILVLNHRRIKKIIKDIKKEIEEYKKSSESDKTLKELVLILIIFPIAIYFMDRYNLFSFLKINENISVDYDWLSFIGAYFGTFISTCFLIYVTRMDRIDSNENVRESQRPYLNTNFYIKKNKDFLSIEDEIYMISNSYDDEIEIPTLKITNAGESVSIIDVEKSYVQIKYSLVEKIESGEQTTNEQTKKLNFDCVIKRLAIPSNKTVFICFDDEDFNIPFLIDNIEIVESYIVYKDLFGKNYVDHIKSDNGKIQVLEDNKILLSDS